MKVNNFFWAFFFIVFSSYTSASFLDSSMENVARKQVAKNEARWTLSSWMQTKKRMALMDQWLLLNTEQTMFEFSFQGAFINYNKFPSEDILFPDDQRTAELFGIQAFFFFLGAEYYYLASNEKHYNKTGLVHLRVLGPNLQSTYIGLQYGIRDHQDSQKGNFSSTLIGAKGTLYLFNFLGLEISYQNIFESSSSTYTLNEGAKHEYSTFLELSALRFTYSMFYEYLKFTSLSNSSEVIEEKRNGGILKLSFYF